VRESIPAERAGRNDSPANEELLNILREDENRIIVGLPGSGKSTLCKQVAISWYEDDNLGDVVYRETGTGSQFTSTDSLKETINRSRGAVLVVVEDAVSEQANTIAETIEAFEGDDSVQFLLDAREAVFERFQTTGSLDVSADRRRGAVLQNVPTYHLPSLSKEDVEGVCEAFTDATGRKVRRDPEVLHADLQKDNLGIGEMLLLAFFLPAADDDEETNGLEDHVRARFETLNPGGEVSLRDLSRFDANLLADVGAMVNLLNASGIGIYQSLVHALVYEHGQNIETHDAIENVLNALEGWVVYRSTGEGAGWQIHPLWSILYLRELAIKHTEHQVKSQRDDRSESRVGTCLESLFRLFDDGDHREALVEEFSESAEVTKINAEPQVRAHEYLEKIFEMGRRWPVLAVLFGTTDTAKYDLPDTASDAKQKRAVDKRAHAHNDRGAYDKAREDHQRLLEESRKVDDRAGIADCLGNLGLVAQREGELEAAFEYYQESFEIAKELGDHGGMAKCLNNLGLIIRQQGDYETAYEYHQESLDIARELGDRSGIADCLGNLGLVVRIQGDYKAARKYHQESLDIARELGDRSGIAESFNNLGLVASGEGDYEAAREYIQQGLQIKRELGDRAGIAHCIGNLGLIAYRQSDYEAAREFTQKSVNIFEELGAVRKELETRRNLVVIGIEANQPERARTYCEDARARLDELNRDFPEERKKLEVFCSKISEE